MCVRRTRVWVCICAHFGFVDSFLFLLHRISCYLLHFQINSVAVGLQFSFADWTHCQCQTENEFFGLYTLCTLLLMLLNWNWSVNYSVGFWFLTHSFGTESRQRKCAWDFVIHKSIQSANKREKTQPFAEKEDEHERTSHENYFI